METIAKVRRLFHKDRLSQREIAKKLQLDRRTVRKYLNSTELPRYQRENYLSLKLGPFKTRLIERLETQMVLLNISDFPLSGILDGYAAWVLKANTLVYRVLSKTFIRNIS